jgi:ribosomal protein S18 acetylase RimI-like enzyme
LEVIVLLATNITCKKLSRIELCNPTYQDQLVKFLFKALEQYRDPEVEIRACLDYIIHPEKGGFVFVAKNEKEELKGVVFLTRTNMDLFVPDYLLVYIAIDKNERGKGIGQQLVTLVKDSVKAPIALHVEHDNPAKRLYERIGFTSKYAEMRWYP